LLEVSDVIRSAIAARADEAELERLAREAGMVDMRHDAWSKVSAGVTTVEEVLRVLS
jgi:type II secretory ATPase GspE/PulE/Tfp pilus assembly ATPase PilB-like protein